MIADPWMMRPPSPVQGRVVEGIHVARTEDALLFERVAFTAAAGTGPSRSGELHPRGSERSRGLHLLVAWRGECPVGTALALVHATGVFVSAVAVLEAERGAGVGTALTATAVAQAADRPATLSASTLGLGVYQRLGFQFVAKPIDWKH